MPVTVLLKLNGPAVVLLQYVGFAGTVTTGVGLTVTVKVCTGPKQLLAVGVTVNIPDVAVELLFVAVNDAMALPEPDAPIPMVVLLFAQV